MKKEYNKLIRDKIPEVIKKSGKEYEIKKLSNDELETYVKTKVNEEIEELLTATERDDVVNEFADVYEILEKLMEVKNIKFEEIKKAKDHKNNKRGSFKKDLCLLWTKS